MNNPTHDYQSFLRKREIKSMLTKKKSILVGRSSLHNLFLFYNDRLYSVVWTFLFQRNFVWLWTTRGFNYLLQFGVLIVSKNSIFEITCRLTWLWWSNCTHTWKRWYTLYFCPLQQFQARFEECPKWTRSIRTTARLGTS